MTIGKFIGGMFGLGLVVTIIINFFMFKQGITPQSLLGMLIAAAGLTILPAFILLIWRLIRPK